MAFTSIGRDEECQLDKPLEQPVDLSTLLRGEGNTSNRLITKGVLGAHDRKVSSGVKALWRALNITAEETHSKRCTRFAEPITSALFSGIEHVSRVQCSILPEYCRIATRLNMCYICFIEI